MDYRDNDVFFKSIPNPLIETYTLTGGKYTIRQLKVTDGQDPDNKVSIGQVKTFGADGKITFELGRKGSKEVANWLNEKIPADHTTFNHAADKLNFAFFGTLSLYYTYMTVDKQGEKITFTFENVALAQGHAGANNNWWFGGKYCKYLEKTGNTVLCGGQAEGALEGAAVMTAGRGRGNDVNEIEVSPLMVWSLDGMVKEI